MDEQELLNQLQDKDVFFFDFDGTLINSEPYHKKAHELILKEFLGQDFVLTDEIFSRYIGRTDKEIYRMFKEDFNLNFDEKQMPQKKVERAKELLLKNNVKTFKYFNSLASNLKDKEFYILSNQDYDLLVESLKQNGIYKYFKEIFSLPKMNVKKDFFISNVSNFVDVQNKKIVIFEDSNKYLSLARENGMFAVGVETLINKGTLSSANIIINCEKE